jgi:SAM-dependent methyltransferase
MREFAAPVSHRMIDALALRTGERVLELAAGLGETGMLAAEVVAPLGGVVISDQAEAMLEGARARALELGLSNIEFQVLDGEWIDLPLASVDAVLCRWGYMLMADPATALAEARRVLRPGGRIALAVWDALAANPWALLPAEELIERGLAPAPDERSEQRPGPFALGSAERVRELLEQAGFVEVELQALELVRYHSLWETTLDLSPSFHNAVLSRPAPEVAEIETSLAVRFKQYTAADGTVAVPGRTLVAAASA